MTTAPATEPSPAETLDRLAIGASARIASVDADNAQLRQHILDMGLTPGTVVTMVKEAPMGDPLELRLRGYELTLRKAEAARIGIAPVDGDASPARPERPARHGRPTAHPGRGEEARGGCKSDGPAIPEGKPLLFGLAGNQNCGKTTLFNQLTGSNQHVGNFPGVTVDRKDGTVRGHPEATVTDLPGIYSLSPYTGEEVVTRAFLLEEHPHAVIDIVDATNIERNLYLTTQLLELDIPMVVALNMMDEMRANGGSVDVNALEEELGVPVVPIAAVRNEGIDELVEHAVNVARNRERPARVDLCQADDPAGGAVHRCIHALIHLIADHAERAGLPLRFAATKLVEGDRLVVEALALDDNETQTVEHIVRQMEEESGKDRLAALADMRFGYIESLCAATVTHPVESREHRRSAAVDRVLTGRYTALPAFIGIMALVFWLTFSVVGQRLSDWLDEGIALLAGQVGAGLEALEVNPVAQSLVVDGIFGGVGSVLVFLPIIITLFFFLSLLEDSGYMARVAFVMDKLLRKLGLSGRSFVPMLIGFGCSVPAIMATRTIPSEHDRRMTIMLTPYMSCSAKLPIYSMISAAFFPAHAALVMLGLYVGGIVVGILVALVLKRTAYRGEPVPFVMELPNYRLPSPRSVGQLIWEKTKDFVQRAFTVIFVATIVVWFLQTFDWRLNVVEDSSQSLLALLGGLIAPVFAPLGFGDWRVSTALVTGFIAKESVVSTLTVLLGGTTAALGTLFTPGTALAFLAFTLLYTPCVATIATVRNEVGTKGAVAMVVMQCAVAWLVAGAVRLATLAIGMA